MIILLSKERRKDLGNLLVYRLSNDKGIPLRFNICAEGLLQDAISDVLPLLKPLQEKLELRKIIDLSELKINPKKALEKLFDGYKAN